MLPTAPPGEGFRWGGGGVVGGGGVRSIKWSGGRERGRRARPRVRAVSVASPDGVAPVTRGARPHGGQTVVEQRSKIVEKGSNGQTAVKQRSKRSTSGQPVVNQWANSGQSGPCTHQTLVERRSDTRPGARRQASARLLDGRRVWMPAHAAPRIGTPDGLQTAVKKSGAKVVEPVASSAHAAPRIGTRGGARALSGGVVQRLVLSMRVGGARRRAGSAPSLLPRSNSGQTAVKQRSNSGQIAVKRRSNGGQAAVKQWSNRRRRLMRRRPSGAPGRPLPVGGTAVKQRRRSKWSNSGQV